MKAAERRGSVLEYSFTLCEDYRGWFDKKAQGPTARQEA